MSDLTIREDAVVYRGAVTRLEAHLKSLPPDVHVDCPVVNYFAPGVYAREITIPAGTLATGKIHLTACLNIISKGRMIVATEEGQREISAPCTFISPAGTKRAGMALEDTVWTTIHPTEETDVDLILETLVRDEYDPEELLLEDAAHDLIEMEKDK